VTAVRDFWSNEVGDEIFYQGDWREVTAVDGDVVTAGPYRFRMDRNVRGGLVEID
jgi:hypothetical protein